MLRYTARRSFTRFPSAVVICMPLFSMWMNSGRKKWDAKATYFSVISANTRRLHLNGCIIVAIAFSVARVVTRLWSDWRVLFAHREVKPMAMVLMARQAPWSEMQCFSTSSSDCAGSLGLRFPAFICCHIWQKLFLWEEHAMSTFWWNRETGFCLKRMD